MPFYKLICKTYCATIAHPRILNIEALIHNYVYIMLIYRFPGMQPVSLNQDNRQMLLSEDFYVCEKSDGVRVLCLATSQGQAAPTVYLCDRNYSFYAVDGFCWPFTPALSTMVQG